MRRPDPVYGKDNKCNDIVPKKKKEYRKHKIYLNRYDINNESIRKTKTYLLHQKAVKQVISLKHCD